MDSRDSLKGTKWRVLNDGHIVLQDFMGSDFDIAESARTSYQQGTRKVSETRGLIRYLMRHRHTTPIEMAELKFHIKLPIFVERQWIRHRTSTTNEVSARYSILPEAFYVPELEDVCAQSKTNKQGRDEPLDPKIAGEFRGRTETGCSEAFADYGEALNQGVARELARIGLPLGTYTEKVWKVDLHNLLHFLSLRMDSHAQWEIRQYANIIGYEIVAKLFPMVWEAFCDYRLNAVTLSALEIAQIRELLQGEDRLPPSEFDRYAIPEWRGDFKNRERLECIAKLKKLGLVDDPLTIR